MGAARKIPSYRMHGPSGGDRDCGVAGAGVRATKGEGV